MHSILKHFFFCGRQRQEDCKCQASLGQKQCFRMVWVLKQDPVTKTNKEKEKKPLFSLLGAIEIFATQLNHAGRYTCLARNAAGSAHRHVTLRVQGMEGCLFTKILLGMWCSSLACAKPEVFPKHHTLKVEVGIIICVLFYTNK